MAVNPATESFKLLTYINDLRTESEQALKALEEQEESNKVLLETLKKDEREQRQLAKEINTMLAQTKDVKTRLWETQKHVLELDAKKGELSFEVDSLKELEREVQLEFNRFQQECAKMLGEQTATIQREYGKIPVLARELQEANEQDKLASVSLSKVQEEQDAQEKRLEGMRQEVEDNELVADVQTQRRNSKRRRTRPSGCSTSSDLSMSKSSLRQTASRSWRPITRLSSVRMYAVKGRSSTAVAQRSTDSSKVELSRLCQSSYCNMWTYKADQDQARLAMEVYRMTGCTRQEVYRNT